MIRFDNLVKKICSKKSLPKKLMMKEKKTFSHFRSIFHRICDNKNENSTLFLLFVFSFQKYL